MVDDLNALLAETEIQVKSEPGWISDTEQRLLELDGRSYLGLITIPTLELQLPVQNEWSYPNLKISPCRMQGNPESEAYRMPFLISRFHFWAASQEPTPGAGRRSRFPVRQWPESGSLWHFHMRRLSEPGTC